MKKIKYVLFTFILCFISLNTVYAEDNITCSYRNGNITLNCDVSQFGVSCSSDDNKIFSDDISKISSALKSSDYNDNGTYSCDKVKSLYIAISDGTTYISSRENDGCPINNNDVAGVWDKIKKDGCGTISLINSTIKEEGNEPDDTNDNKTDTNETWTPKAFCQKDSVKGTFRIVGWVIFIIKILVPILLIVFGSIDFAKAVLASKDDEIKKSMKTLVVRVIAGIIIFFIPTILNFTIKLIGGENIYNEENNVNTDSFGYCTHCMLEPTDDACGNLLGGK